MIFLYQSGRITSEKMQLQNAADAAAYGASVLEARSLNFAAYTNRAMVANEVAIGQMVGVLSWIDELKAMGEDMQEYADFIDTVTAWLWAIITVGDVIEAIIDGITQALATVGEVIAEAAETVQKILDPITSVIIRGLSTINQVYSTSQTIYHGATIVLVTSNIFKSLEDNVPGTSFNPIDFFKKNKPGAQLSDLGIIALAGHIPSFWSGYTTQYSQDSKDDDNNNDDDDNGQGNNGENSGNDNGNSNDGSGGNGKDKNKDHGNTSGCSKKKNKHGDTSGCSKKKKKNREEESGESGCSDDNQGSSESGRSGTSDDNGGNDDEPVEADEGMSRLAATIRLARDPFSSGGPPVTDRNIFNHDMDYFNRDWRFGLGHDFHYDIDILNLHLLEVKGDVNIFLGVDSRGGTEIRYKDGAYTWSALDTVLAGGELDFSTIVIKILTYDCRIPGETLDLGLPLGGGGYQANGGENSGLTVADMVPPLPELPLYDRVKSYGSAGSGESRLLAYMQAAAEMEENQVMGRPYGGLRPYRDMKKVEVGPEKPESVPPEDIASQMHIPFTEPYFLVGVFRQMSDITDKGPQFSGPLDLINDPDNKLMDRVATIARSELYFKRPTDLFYFLRKDRMTEKPNVFSPFWQARLAETSDTDRFLALALQQHTIWLSGKTQQDIPGLQTIVDKTETFIQDLEDIFNLF